jgi:hypothetical protein
MNWINIPKEILKLFAGAFQIDMAFKNSKMMCDI